jgi:uncharacterized protein
MSPLLLGLISDTHGLLRPSALAALQGSQAIIHAGDVGEAGILDQLRTVAPLYAVRGNVDTQTWAKALPPSEIVQLQGISIYVLHNLSQLDLDPAASRFDIVVSGHSHQPQANWRDGVLYINPGSAGPRRFSLPVSVARLDLRESPWKPEFIDLGSREVAEA